MPPQNPVDHTIVDVSALGKDAPKPRQREFTDGGKVVAVPMVGGLHHRYTRRAAYAKISGRHGVGWRGDLRQLGELTRMPRSTCAFRAVGNPREDLSSVRWVTFAIISAHISRADNVLRNDSHPPHHGDRRFRLRPRNSLKVLDTQVS